MSTQSNQLVPFKDKVASVRTMLDKSKGQLAMALPRHISADRMLRVAMTSIQKVPKLLECSQTSLLAAIMQSAQLGLEPDGLLGQAYLVPFKQTVTLIIGYKGLLKLARNSGEISTIQAHEVFTNDKFHFEYGLSPKLEHTPTQEDPGEVVAFYAVATLKGGGTQFEVMWRRQVDKIRDGSQGYQAAKKFNSVSPWDSHYEEMGKKTVLRKLCKMLPSSVELQRAITLDEQAEAGISQDLDPIDITPESEAPKSKLDALVDAKAKKTEKAKPVSEPTPEPTKSTGGPFGEEEMGGDLFGREPGVEG